ncbi:MAG: alpha/beta hydrolase [Clostridiales bacterium]|nr:alpha/beta hydrolase [Clostridiales bacterium]
MRPAVVYFHGKGGNTSEADHFIDLFPESDVIGFDYRACTPWEANREFPLFFNHIQQEHPSVKIIANSIGAYFVMDSLSNQQIDRAYFISPIVNMEKLITDMLLQINATENSLRSRKTIPHPSGEVLSWDYLCYTRSRPVRWQAPTHILYGSKDYLTAMETISEFAKQIHATLTILEGGEHWFHTEKQLRFLDAWITRYESSNDFNAVDDIL